MYRLSMHERHLSGEEARYYSDEDNNECGEMWNGDGGKVTSEKAKSLQHTDTLPSPPKKTNNPKKQQTNKHTYTFKNAHSRTHENILTYT